MIRLIVARSRNGVIGAGGGIPWRLRDDMRFFRRTTLGSTVIMGRKTFESIGGPLADRRNIVLTRDPSFRAEGVLVARSPAEALQISGGDAFVIGGESVYEAFMPLAEEIFMTEVDAHVDGDTRLPELVGEWDVEEIARYDKGPENEYPFRILHLTRRKQPPGAV